MLLITVSFDLRILYFVAANIIAILVYVLVIKHRARREKRNIAAISKAVVEYFRKNGVEVSVGCIKLLDNKRFTAFIESEPMKRFRLSHLVEITLRDYVQKACGLELDKVYWRFPIKAATPEVSVSEGTLCEANQLVKDDDEYISEGLLHHENLLKYEVTETSWEKFEEASTIKPQEK